MRNYHDLKVWQKTHQLTLDVYRSTKNFPKDEMYGLTMQIRRACVSIEANLAEGCGRTGDGEFGRFIKISAGSASEVDCHFLIARDLKYLGAEEYEGLRTRLEEIRRMLTALLQTIESKQRSAAVGAKS